MRTVFFHNPTAGAKDHDKDALLAVLRGAGLDPCYCSTKHDGFADMLRASAELIVVAGGDGTVAKVLARLKDRSIPVVILPLGTANNIARSLGVVDPRVELAEVLRSPKRQPFSIGAAHGPWGRGPFVEAVGVGALAQSIRKRPGKKPKGMDGLRAGRRHLCRLIEESEPLELDISIDGEEIEEEVLAVEVLNVAFTGPALPLAPGADPGDRHLDVVLVTARRREEMMGWVEAPLKEPPPVDTRRGRKVTIKGRLPFQRVDDDVFEPTESKDKIAIELGDETVTVLVPPWAECEQHRLLEGAEV